MESFNLNIIPGKDRPVCHASQYDIGRTIHVNLFEGFNVFTLDGTEVISISVRKPDGNVVTESVTNTSDSYVEFVTTEQMTACHGSNLCELKLEKGADVIGTMNFILEVEQDPLDGGVQSDTNIHNLQTQVADLVAIEVADQYDSANVIFDPSPVPGHGNGYAVTSEGVATELALKQDATDANLQTTDTTIVGAINELNSGKQDATDSNLQTTDQTVVGAINELKSDADANFDYSANETVIGDYFGYTLYRKYFDIGTLPNNATKSTVVLNSRIRDLVNLRIIARTTGGDSFVTVPYLSSSAAFNIECDVECTGGTTKVNVTTHMDRTGMVAFGIIEYLK